MNNLSNNAYIVIDDVSLVESCELNCHTTSGIPNPIIGTPTSYNVPLQVTNIANVEKLKIEIIPITGQSSIYTLDYNYSNGIPGNIYWNGEILWGGAAAIGTYICRLTCENDCGVFVFSQQFVNVGAYAPYPPNRPLNNIEEKNFNPCCLIDYSLQDISFNSAKTYQVKQYIYVNNNVSANSNSDLDLKAGKNIGILGEFAAQSNSEFSAEIIECPDAHRQTNNVLTNKDFIFYNENSFPNLKKQVLGQEKTLIATPNPTKDKISIRINKNINKADLYLSSFADSGNLPLVFLNISNG